MDELAKHTHVEFDLIGYISHLWWESYYGAAGTVQQEAELKATILEWSWVTVMIACALGQFVLCSIFMCIYLAGYHAYRTVIEPFPCWLIVMFVCSMTVTVVVLVLGFLVWG